MKRVFYDNFATTSTNAPLGSTATTLNVADATPLATPGSGERLYLTILDDPYNPTAYEIVEVTGVSGSALTVVRGQESTTGVEWPSGSYVQCRLTAGAMNDLLYNHTSTTSVVDTVAVTPGTVVAVDEVAAVGQQPTLSALGVSLLGAYCTGQAEYSTLLGAYANAVHAAEGATVLGTGGTAHGPDGVVLGPNEHQFAKKGLTHAVYPALQRTNSLPQLPSNIANKPHELNQLTSLMMVATCWVELGAGQSWAGSTAYADGDIVVPTTPNGYQYMMLTDIDAGHTSSGDTNTYTMTTGASEPTWGTTVGGTTLPSTGYAGLDRFYTCDIESGYILEVPPGMIFMVEEVGFICTKYTNVNAKPFISVGDSVSSTSLVNNQQLTGITGAGQVQSFTSGMPIALEGTVASPEELVFTLETAGTSTGGDNQFYGRFYAKGYFIQRNNENA